MRTTIDIDNALLRRAMKLSGHRTKKATVEAGLRLLVEVKAQAKVRLLRGKVRWEDIGDRGLASGFADDGRTKL